MPKVAGQSGPLDRDEAGLSMRHARVPPALILAGAFAVGIAVGAKHEVIVPWLAVAAAFVVLGSGVRIRWPRVAIGCACIATLCFSAAWVTYRHHHVPANDLAAWLGEQSVMVRAEGVATATPEFRRRTGGSLAAFDYRSPSTFFPMRVDHLLTRNGEHVKISGRVYVKLDDAIAPFRAGDRVTVHGHLVPIHRPLNPGEFDVQAYARALGQAGLLVVPDRRLVHVTPATRSGVMNAWYDLRDTVRRRAAGQLLADLPQVESTHRDALLKALLLGQREPDLEGISESFRRVGLAHLMAISGLHLGILAGLVLALARLAGHDRQWHGWLIIAVVLGYLMLVEVRLPVQRAGIMTIAACVGIVLGRNLHVGGLVALSGIGLLLWRPEQLFTAGFQLSFGVVLGLIFLQPIVRERWFGRPDLEAASTAQMIGQWGRGALATAAVAWMVATPIVIHHFGLVSTFGIPLSVLGVPIVAVILAIGYAKMLLSLVLPSIAVVLGIPLTIVSETMIAIVQAFDSLPMTSWHVPFGSVMWTLVALGFVTCWGIRREGVNWRITASALAVLSVWLFWPLLPIHTRPALRLDMIAVGDGTCIVLRSEGKTFVFDAGSNTSLDAGRRWIVPALRHLNVRSIDAIAISHPDLDHYSAVLELVDEFNVPRVLVTPQFIDTAKQRPHSAVAYLTDGLAQRRVAMQEVVAGHREQWGAMHLTWHHPDADPHLYARDNEHSMVIDVAVAGRNVLLTGDLDREGMARLMPSVSSLRADVVELPHHGSYNELASEFIRELQPRIVLQSTGRARFMRDRWADELADVQRYVTIRDGASWVEIDHDGTITSGSFVE